MDRLWQSSRRLGQWRGRSDERAGDGAGSRPLAWRTRKAGLETETHDYSLRLGWRRTGAFGLNRMGRDARRRVEQEMRRLFELRFDEQRSAGRRRIAYP